MLTAIIRRRRKRKAKSKALITIIILISILNKLTTFWSVTEEWVFINNLSSR